jgi:hypothetical protein
MEVMGPLHRERVLQRMRAEGKDTSPIDPFPKRSFGDAVKDTLKAAL